MLSPLQQKVTHWECTFYQELLFSSMGGDFGQQHLRNLQSGTFLTAHLLQHPYRPNCQECGELILWKEKKKPKRFLGYCFELVCTLFLSPAILLLQSIPWETQQMEEHFAPFFPGNRVEMKLATAHAFAVKGSSVLSKELFTSCMTGNKLISTIYFINFNYCKLLA